MHGEEQLSLFIDPVQDERIICGADEAGRGPLAGPVFAAAVVLPPDFPFELLADSKAMGEKARNKAEAVIREKAIAFAVTSKSAEEIDHINILNASLEAMKEAYQEVKKQTKVDVLLVDGNKEPASIDCEVHAIVKGDAKIQEIMAASILAKNARDRYMVEMDKKYPGYGFAIHKGYPTKAHCKALLEMGPSPIHRKTFHVKKLSTYGKELF